MPLSLTDMPAVRTAIEDLYRILEHPTPANEHARRVYRWATGRTTLGEQNPDTAGAGALIQAAIEQVLFHFGDHTRDACPEITDSHLDLKTKAALLDLRGELTVTFAGHTLGKVAGKRFQFLEFLTDVLGRIAPVVPPPADSSPPLPPGTTPVSDVDAYDPCDREPRTYWELAVWLAHWAAFNNPRFPARGVPTVAHSAAHHYLECYCREEFGTFDLGALGRLRDRYMVRSGKTAAETEETTLYQLADHFRLQTVIAAAQTAELAGPSVGRTHGIPPAPGSVPSDPDPRRAEFGLAGPLIALGREMWDAVANHVPRARECDVHSLNRRVPEAVREAMRAVPHGTPAFPDWERRVLAVRSACGELLQLGAPFPNPERSLRLATLSAALLELDNAAVSLLPVPTQHRTGQETTAIVSRPDNSRESAQAHHVSPLPDPFATPRTFARDKLRIGSIERIVVEALCDSNGAIPIADLAVRKDVNWSEPKTDFKRVQDRLNSQEMGRKKLILIGWRLMREQNVAKLICLDAGR